VLELGGLGLMARTTNLKQPSSNTQAPTTKLKQPSSSTQVQTTKLEQPSSNNFDLGCSSLVV
jgi:hypothetical protein